MNFKAVTFDIGGVLYSDDVFKRAIKKALSELNPKVSDAKFEEVYEQHLISQSGSLRTKLCLEFLGDIQRKDELLRLTDRYWLFESSDMYHDCLVQIRELKNNGYAVGIIANQPATVKETLANDQVLQNIDFLGISALVGLEKPNPVLFQLAVDSLGFAANEIVHVGNRIDNDVIPAKSIGMKTVWLRRGEANPNPSASDLKEADLTVTDLNNLIDTLIKL